MKRIIDMETEEDFEEFKEVLSQVRHSNTVASLKQAMQMADGEYNYSDLQQSVTDARMFLNKNDNFFYITLLDARRIDLQKMKSMWNIMLQRGTAQYEERKANDYVFEIDIINNDERSGTVFSLTAVQPVFMSSDGDKDLMFVFPLENVRYSKDFVSIYDIEYEEALREGTGNPAYDFKDYDDDEAEEKEEMEKFFDDSDLTEV